MYRLVKQALQIIYALELQQGEKIFTLRQTWQPFAKFIQDRQYTEWAKKCILNLTVLTINDISASQERLCHLLRKYYNSARAIC